MVCMVYRGEDNAKPKEAAKCRVPPKAGDRVLGKVTKQRVSGIAAYHVLIEP